MIWEISYWASPLDRKENKVKLPFKRKNEYKIDASHNERPDDYGYYHPIIRTFIDASHNERPDDWVVISVISFSTAIGMFANEPISPTSLKLRKLATIKTKKGNKIINPMASNILLRSILFVI